jgi:hypothetical protein
VAVRKALYRVYKNLPDGRRAYIGEIYLSAVEIVAWTEDGYVCVRKE